MEIKSLFLGILFSIGVFAVKSGVGIFYFVSAPGSKIRKTAGVLGFAAAYFCLFIGAALVIDKVNLLRHLDAVQDFIRSGMTLHLLMAGILALWGVSLLKKAAKPHENKQKTRAWLMLAVPCPVCATVIFFSVGFLTSFFPENAFLWVGILYGVFIAINVMSIWVMKAQKDKSDTPEELMLGSGMLVISCYFFLSVTMLPQFADVDKIYRMAMNNSGDTLLNLQDTAAYIIFIAAAFVIGFIFKILKIRRSKKWMWAQS